MTRVLVTRAVEDAERLVRALEQADLEPLACPLVSTEAVPGPVHEANQYAWVVFTSRAGVRFGLRRLAGTPRRVAAVGPGTARALREAGVAVDLVPPTHTQRGLVEALGPDPGSVLFAGAERAGDELTEILGAHHPGRVSDGRGDPDPDTGRRPRRPCLGVRGAVARPASQRYPVRDYRPIDE